MTYKASKKVLGINKSNIAAFCGVENEQWKDEKGGQPVRPIS